jgi:hypothetical protein
LLRCCPWSWPLLLAFVHLALPSLALGQLAAFLTDHGVACHDVDSKTGGLDRIETNGFSSGKGTFRGLEMA